MKKLIITPKGEQLIDMSQDEIKNRLSQIEHDKILLNEFKEKENKKELALQRLKASSNQDIIDLLTLII